MTKFTEDRLQCIYRFAPDIVRLENPMTILNILSNKVLDEDEMIFKLNNLEAPYDDQDEVAKEILEYYFKI